MWTQYWSILTHLFKENDAFIVRTRLTYMSAITGTIYFIYNYILTGITLNQREGSGFRLKFVEGIELRFAQLV
jgi:hypothetical protein